MQATDTPSIIHRYFMIKNSSFQTCNTLNIKALELYYNIKKWNIELDTLYFKRTIRQLFAENGQVTNTHCPHEEHRVIG